METTIFSKSMGVMCFSRPLLVLLVESVRRSSGRAFGMMAVADAPGDMPSSRSSSDEAESRLDDNSGTGMLVGAAFGLTANEHRGENVEAFAWCFGSQQNVSRFQSRQLRFSNRLPSSIACDVLENSDHCSKC